MLGKVAMTIANTSQIELHCNSMPNEIVMIPLPDLQKNARWLIPYQYFGISKTTYDRRSSHVYQLLCQ
jgi:hypothetical protein